MTKARDLANIISGGFTADDIPNLDASKITTGTITPSDGTVTTDKIVDANITLAKLSATGTPSSSTFLRGDNSWVSAGGTNTPAFEAQISSDQTVSNFTDTKAQCNLEVFDTDSCYDNVTNYRFTPNVAGKYFVYGQIYGDVQNASDWNYTNTQIRKNGIISHSGTTDNRNNPGREGSVFMATTMIMNGTTDYVELWGQVYAQDGAGMRFSGTVGTSFTRFGAYKIIE